MCLVDKKRFRFTIFPKIVYKRFYYYPDTKELKNYCQLNEVTSRVLVPNSYDEPEYNNAFKDYSFGIGFIHALQPLLGGNPYSSVCESEMKDYVIYSFKCMIPPFTRYAKDSTREICARKMIIIDKLADNVFN